MKIVWKLLCLLGFIVFAVVTVFAYATLSQASPPELLRPLMAVCVVFAVGGAIRSINATFTKRHTTATGFG
jgi:O-antigen/teichoic acid export membrane protein